MIFRQYIYLEKLLPADRIIDLLPACQCFPVCPPRETLLWKQKFLPGKQKCFPINSETFLLRIQCISVFPHVSSAIGMRMNKYSEKMMPHNVI